MCEYPCLVPILKKKIRELTLLLLDCWQREYDKRPYRNFVFERLKFEERLDRDYDHKEDLKVIVSFLATRFLYCIKLVGLRILADDIWTLYNFVKSLQKFRKIELILMELPTELFRLLAHIGQDMRAVELSLEGTPLNDKDVEYLSSFILKSQKLTKLNVSSCSITQYNFAELADAIHKSVSLRSCNMSRLLGLHLTFDSDKMAHIVASLIWQNKLNEIILEKCGFIGHDMEIIAEYLYSKCSKLETLSVSYNVIGANGARALLKAISSSGTLKHLKMNGCSLATHGGQVVAQYLSSCWNLESLEIQRNNINADAINMILLCMKKSCKLQKLYFFGNSFNKRTGSTLRRLIESGVLPQDYIDSTITFDDTLDGYRVIPWLP